MKPTINNLIVRAVEEKSMFEIPDSAKTKPMNGEIVEVSDDSLFVKGDKIIFKKYAADEIQVKEETLLVIREEDVLVIL